MGGRIDVYTFREEDFERFKDNFLEK